MRKKINQLFLVAALMCGAISMTSCQGLIDAIVGSTDNPSEVKVDVDKLTPEQIAQAVKLLEDVQKEGAQLTVSFTYKTVDYDATFEKKGDDYELLAFMSGGSPASVDFKPYLTLTIPDDWTEEDIDNYIVVPEDGDGLIVDDEENEGDEDDGEDDGDDEGDDDDDEGDDEGDDDDGEAEGGNDEGGIHLTRGAVEIPALDFIFGLAQSESDDLVQAQISTKEATATLVGDYENFDVKNLTMPASGSVASTRAAQSVTVYLIKKQGNEKDYEVKKVTVDPEIKELQCQQSVTLTAAYSPETAKIYGVKWKTTDVNVLSIQPLSTFTAKVTAIAAGNATIYAIINGKNKTFTIKVPEVLVESMALDQEEAKVAINPAEKRNKGDGFLQLQAIFFPDYATKKAVKWTSSNTHMATVSSKGLVTVKNKSDNVDKDVTITCTNNKSGKSATCTIHIYAVEGFAFVESMSLDKSDLTLTEGDEATLEAILSPDDATNREVTWTSSKPTVATVDQNGKVTALKAGKTTIKVRALGSKGAKKTAKCKVTVNKLSDPIVGPSGGFDNGGDPTL